MQLFCFCQQSLFRSNAFAQSPASVEAPELVTVDCWVFRYVDLYNNEKLNKWEPKVTGLHDDSVRFTNVTLANKNAAKVGKLYRASASRSILTPANSLIVGGNEVRFDFPPEVGKTWIRLQDPTR